MYKTEGTNIIRIKQNNKYVGSIFELDLEQFLAHRVVLSAQDYSKDSVEIIFVEDGMEKSLGIFNIKSSYGVFSTGGYIIMNEARVIKKS